MITNVTVVQGIALQPGPQGPPGTPGAPGSITGLDVARGWNTVQWTVPTDLTYNAGGTTTWDVSVHPNARLALTTGNTTMALLNVVEGAYYALRTVQDATARTITWGSSQGFHWPSATPIQPSTRDGAIDLWHWRGAPSNVIEFAGMQPDVH
jgi:hypothetical protein